MSLYNKINIVADVWKETRNDILMSRSFIPSAMGLTSSVVPKANVGRAEGKGVDFSVDYNQQLGQHTWIQGRANFTYAVSNYLAYEEPLYAKDRKSKRLNSSH